MKRFLSIILALLSAFVLASCKGTNDKDAQNTAPPHSAASETAAPTETPTAAPETEAPMADLNPRPDPGNCRMACSGNAVPLLRRLYEP